ncbi:negative regulation of ERBB signaling pathway [Nesidiocoris tenuis]|uniref:Negative regulation of ERBB signaling pathway n=1 Tax=Nesidiocoris tenuis TaxID=355587 RepID=A0ABN7A570_9HEMI|nr:negative regulation of ERBB signaling pathway [Nesidiocoris tenuis]
MDGGRGTKSEEARDTREGENITLECRFSRQLTAMRPAYFWVRTNRRDHDNVAIQGTPLDANYRLDFRPEDGCYDLHISNVSYERDDGKFECRLKVSGSGQDIHSQGYTLTVLTPPGHPRISPSANPTATEGQTLELTCASKGGSPDPTVRWFRQGVAEPMEATIKTTMDQGVVSTLTLKPDKTDDGAVFKCIVWNRAMPAGDKLETTVNLNVNYYPRVDVGPDPTIRVERDGNAVLNCNVDAKPRVSNVRWIRDGRFISTQFKHTIKSVTTQEAGKYKCTADNGLGQSGEAEVFLDVQYPPQVSVETGPGIARQKEAEEGEMVTIRCNVSANPPPISIEWLRDGRPDFRQNGDVLKLHRVSADSAGTYMCRATNVLSPTSATRQRSTRVGNATVTLLVRHRPGKAQITPDRPVASEGNAVTLTCSASPPGWPTPQYRWWRELEDPTPNSQITVLATGPKYNIPSAHLGSEGKYHCEANNEMGHGEKATVVLTVYQPPRFLVKLQPHLTKRIGETEFSVTCGAQGKPKPTVTWLKDGKELLPTLFDVSTDESEGRNSVYTVQSTLRFVGRERPSGSQLIPSDRGEYTCIFENEVKPAKTTMHLRIEHEPITLHKYNKVAYDLRETAEVICKVKAYPRPEFQWSYSTNTAPLLAGADGHYEINTTVNESGGDVYTSVLQISNVRQADYGEYNCRVANTLGSVKTQIRLQPKGAPERPESLRALDVGHSYITLQWTPGFNGGLQSTKYFVSYKRVLTTPNDDCYAPKKNGIPESWHEFDCQTKNPCNVTNLEQHQSYLFKVKAYNTKGQSNYSEEAAAMTKVDKIPSPQRVTFDPESHELTINIAATCLQLIAMVEVSTSMYGHNWRLVETMSLSPSGSSSRKEATVLSLMPRRAAKTSGRALEITSDDDDIIDDHSVDNVRVRVRYCLQSNKETCGDYTEAEIGPSFIKEASAIAMPTLVAIVVSCVVFILLSALAVVFCCCRKTPAKKATSKDYEMDTTSVHPSIVQQAPPPYYPASGMENKALEHSMDLALDDPNKAAIYAAQNGYGYHVSQPQHPNGGESGQTKAEVLPDVFAGVNMGYMENSYSNSNNGGSVNSQDSLWQMKMAAQANNAANMAVSQEHHHHHLNDRNNPYGVYDPLNHGGYGTVDDYAPYPHLMPSATPDYSRSNNPSRQEYSQDKTLRQHHMESPYHDVSGLPDPYMDHHMMMEMDESMKQQHQSQNMPPMSFDETLESGYSTPNSRSGRMIREIIV